MLGLIHALFQLSLGNDKSGNSEIGDNHMQDIILDYKEHTFIGKGDVYLQQQNDKGEDAKMLSLYIHSGKITLVECIACCFDICLAIYGALF